MQRQDERVDILNFESFKIETASRKVLGELTQQFL